MGYLLLFSVLFFSFLFAACAGQQEYAAPPVALDSVPAAELIEKADELYNKRSDNLNNVRSALELLRQARINEATNFEAVWRAAQFHYFLGDNAKSEKERDKAFKDGVAAGKSAISLQPDRPEGYFWTGANQGGQARASVLDAAANVEAIRRNMQKVIELKPDYQGATAFVVLGKIEIETRGMLGGDAEKAVRLLEEALRYEKKNPMIYVSLAEAYFYTDRKTEARRMLAEMRKLPKDAAFEAEQRQVEAEAEKLERKL